MRVLVVINALGEGGTERSMAELIPRMESSGVEFTLATLRSRGDEGVEPGLRAAGYDIRRLPTGPQRLTAYRRLVDDVRPDLVHSMLYESNLLARVASVGKSPKVLTSLVNMSYSPERIATPGTERWKVRVVQAIDAITSRLFVDHFHAVSDAVKQDAVEHLKIPSRRITVVPRGRTDPRVRQYGDVRRRTRVELGVPEGALVVVNVGRHEFQKDQTTLIEAVAPLVDERDDLWLLIAGRDGAATSTIVRRLEALGNPSRVHLLGHRGDVDALLASADVFVTTTRYEGLPGAVIEAMAAGLPIVASDIAPVAEVVERDRSALLAKPGDVHGFRRAIDRLIGDAEARRGLAQRGREIFEQRFTIDVAAEGMVALYRSVVGEAT